MSVFPFENKLSKFHVPYVFREYYAPYLHIYVELQVESLIPIHML